MIVRRMWPRLLEGALGAWLLVSPWVLGTPTTAALRLGGVDLVPLVGGIALVGLTLAAFRFRNAHTGVLVVGVALIAFNWLAYPRPGPASAQNGIAVGLMVCLFAIIPNDSDQPPVGWRPLTEHSDGR
jgi:hypothetical protein